MSIFTHVTLGTDDLANSHAFFDAGLSPAGIERLFDTDDRGRMFPAVR